MQEGCSVLHGWERVILWKPSWTCAISGRRRGGIVSRQLDHESDAGIEDADIINLRTVS